jgi:hypothetical protein
MAIIAVDDNRPFIFLDVIVIIDIQRISKLRLQTSVTCCDIKRIGVISDFEQLCYVGLAGITPIVYPDVLLVIKLIVEINSRGKVDDIADGIDIQSSIILNEIGVLGL